MCSVDYTLERKNDTTVTTVTPKIGKMVTVSVDSLAPFPGKKNPESLKKISGNPVEKLKRS